MPVNRSLSSFAERRASAQPVAAGASGRAALAQAEQTSGDDRIAPPGACTVYFDGACPLCRREIAHYQRRTAGAAILWIDASSCDEAALGGDLSRSQALSRLHVRAAEGGLVSGAAAFTAIWARVPGYRWLSGLARLRPMQQTMELAYTSFLRLRPLWRRAQPAVAADAAAPKESAQDVPWPAAAKAVTPPAARPGLPFEALAGLRALHAGALAALHLHRGVLATAADGELRAFAAHRLASELLRLQRIGRCLPAASRSRLLPLWRIGGWLAGAVPALLGRRAASATVAAVERVLARHGERQVWRLAVRPDLAGLRLAPEVRSGVDTARGRAASAGLRSATGAVSVTWPARVGSGPALAAVAGRRVPR